MHIEMFRKLLRFLFGSDHPSVKRIMACEDAVNALTARVDARYDELIKLRGVVSRMKRELLEEKPAEDDPGVTNGTTPDAPPHPRSYEPTPELGVGLRRS